ncbi:UNVERIFIED_CONTAM: hypothetical protein GTU68_058269 [Idotea baltica]|nr:hypothetical protein [Idotea baltica]
MSADKEVMEYFPSTLSRIESDTLAEKCQLQLAETGWGVWAVELSETEQFIGIIGLNVPSKNLSFSPCVEILWRIARPYWGSGYATEGARAALRVGFEELNLQEIVSFAVVKNHRSRAIMEKLKMTNAGKTFDHPEVPTSSDLKEHCLYRILRKEYYSRNKP